ncbi:MAG: tetratricopeptide repeat protein [Chitinophagaceae bacterium]
MKLLRIFLFSFLIAFTSPAKAQIDSILFDAIKRNDLIAVQQRLKNKIDINATDKYGANAFKWAVYYSDLSIVKYLIKQGASVADSSIIYLDSGASYSILQGIAACKGKLELLKFLADSLQLSLNEKGLDRFTNKKVGWTSLFCAVQQGHIDIVKYLLQKLQNDLIYENETTTALIVAAENEQWEIWDLLLTLDNYKNRFGKQVNYFKSVVVKLKQPFENRMARNVKVHEFALELIKAYFGESTVAYARGLNVLAEAYDNASAYEKAEQAYLMAIELLKRISREDHFEYKVCLDRLAVNYYFRGQYEKALILFEQVQAIIKKSGNEEKWLGAHNLTHQALCYGKLGKYDKALTLYQQALAIAKKTGNERSRYAWISNNFAALYTSMGLHREAIPLYQEALAIKKEVHGENSDEYARSLSTLAHAFIALGQYTEALPLLEQASVIMKKSFGEKHQYYAAILDGHAFIYERIGEYNKATFLYKKALTIYKEALGEGHPFYASGLNNLALLYMDQGEFTKALSLYQQALDVRKKSLKEEHPDYAQSLTNLAIAYQRKKLYDTSLQLYRQALALAKKTVGEQHHFYANCLANLASLQVSMGNYDTAANLYQQTLVIRKKIFGTGHPEDVEILNKLGMLYKTLGNDREAVALLTEASKLQFKQLNNVYSTISEQEKMIFLNKEAYQFNYLPSLLFAQKAEQAFLLEHVYQNELTLKGIVLKDQQTVLTSIRKNNDSISLSLYNNWRFNKAFLGQQQLLPLHKRVSYFDSLQEITNHLEQQISRRSVAFNKHQHNQNITLTYTAQKLKTHEAAVEFIRFPLYSIKSTDSVMYAAMLLLPGDSVARFIPLCEEKQLFRLLKSSANGATDEIAIEQLYGNGTGAGTLSDSLYQLTWHPIEKHLKGINTVYYAPAGLLHRISFQALRPDATHFLLDKYHLNQVLSTRSVVSPVSSTSKPLSAGIWGNINYTMNNSTASGRRTSGQQNTRGLSTDTTVSTFNFYNADTRGLRGGSEWDALPSTKQEMDSLKILFQNNGISTATFSGSLASEEMFKKLDGKSPQILRTATHGFFLPTIESKLKNDYPGNAFKVQQNPMFRSGLVLAGGNNAWKGKPAIPGKEDGILTAYEIAQMDLSNTELVVLSACETALGDVEGNEGVIGLQRAFKMAGVKQVMVSLWSVYDKPTMELMILFYRNRLSGQPTQEALRNSQLKIKEKYPDPYYWAAFVAIE